MAKEANNNAGEIVSITAEKLTREDTIVVNELGAIIEKGLVLHGANPAVNVGDALVAVNGEQFASIEDLTQLFTKATTEGKALQLQFSRVKQQQANTIDLKKSGKRRAKVEFVEKALTLRIPFSVDDFLGIHLNKDIVITKIQPGSCGAEMFEVNDRIVEINNMKLCNNKQVDRFLDKCDNDLTVVVMRQVPKNPDANKQAASEQDYDNDDNFIFDHSLGLFSHPVIPDSTAKKLDKSPQVLYKNIKCEKVNIFTDLVVRFTYFVMFLFARIREYLQKNEILAKMGHKELEKHADFVPIIGGPESLFIRNIYRLGSDVVNHVVASVPGTKMVVKERVTDNFGWSYRLTGKKIDTTNMGSYNYLGFAQNKGPVTDYAASFVDDFGVYSSAAICGLVPRHIRQLEARISGFIGTEDAIVFPMGFGTNSMNIPSLIGQGGLILSDKLNHASIVLGCRLSGAQIAVFEHNDPEDLERKLRTLLADSIKSKNPYKKILIIVEGIYSMEGTICDLPRFIEIKKKYNASLFIDEAHSIGALGPHGKGITDYFNLNPRDVDVMMGTLTKSFAGAGGYIAGSKTLISHLRKTSHDTYYGSFMAPAVVGQIIGAIDCLEQVDEYGETDAQKRAKKLTRNTLYLRALFQKHGFLIYGHEHSPVVPVMVFHVTKGAYFVTECLKRGLSLAGVCFPAVPLTKCRIRFCLSSAHTKEDIDDVMHMANQVADEIDAKYAQNTKHDLEIEY